MQLPPDLTSFVSTSFSLAQQTEALSLLEAAKLHDGTRPGARILRCALVASGGELVALARLVDQLAFDYRDVILAGEYELRGKETVRVRDLSEPLRPEV